ncbi:MAG: hypothetical protein QNJ16_13060 [Rhodobacter sp.]|nr:hypothetical protein [Rhodobacter sp.]
MNTQNTSGTAPERKRDWYLLACMAGLPLLAVAMLGFGLHQMGTASGGIAGWVKLLIICAAAYAASYGILRLSIDKGIPLYTRGRRAAPVVCLTAILLIGTAFFLTTAPGYVMPSVVEAELTDHQDAFSDYAIGRVAVADKAKDLVPAMQSIAEDLQAKHLREADTGYGPIAQALDALATRANGLATVITGSLGVRQGVLDDINTLREDMAPTLADESTSIWERRAALRRQHSQMLSLLAELERAIPVSVVQSYAGELNDGVLIPDREEANARINRDLSGYSSGLTVLLAEQRGVAGPPPEFPEKPGSLDTFHYMGKYAPIFLLTFAVDLIFPVLLFMLTLWTVASVSPPPARVRKPRVQTDTDVLTGLKAMDVRRLAPPEDPSSDAADDASSQGRAEDDPKPAPPLPHRKPRRPNGKSKC